ncbi:MAG: PA2169 family four-helix-bundle protein [Terracidiphilus sp.]
MSNPSQDLKETESTLRNVIEVLIDCQERFQEIGDHLQDETLKRYFLAESLKRARFRGDLENVLHQEGVHDVKESGSTGGMLHRKWADLKAKLGLGDHTLLETAEEGEDTAKKVYSDAMKEFLPLPVRQMLATQAAHIETSHDYIKAARDSRK